MRIALALVVVSPLVVLGACGGDDGSCVDRGAADPSYAHKDGQGTYAGDSCLESGCHLAGALGAQAPAFHAGGTVFKSDGTPQAGVHVKFSPLSGTGAPLTVVTDTAGNFFVQATMTAPFPAIPEVSACPSSASMIEGALDPSYGSCATASCHSMTSGRGPIILD